MTKGLGRAVAKAWKTCERMRWCKTAGRRMIPQPAPDSELNASQDATVACAGCDAGEGDASADLHKALHFILAPGCEA